MKKLVLVVVCFVTFQSNALDLKNVTSKAVMCDQVAIPDRNFEQALLDQNIDTDGVLNGKICRTDAESVTSFIYRRKKYF